MMTSFIRYSRAVSRIGRLRLGGARYSTQLPPEKIDRLVRDRVKSQFEKAQQEAEIDAKRTESEVADEKIVTVSLSIAHDLVYEVGWESRHTFIDVRPSSDFVLGRAKGALNVPADDALEDRAREIIPSEPGRLVVGGAPSAFTTKAAERLRALGFRCVVADAPFSAWKRRGLPVEVGDTYQDPNADDDLLDDDEEEDFGDPSTWK